MGGSLPMHRHDKTEEIAYFISGEGIVLGYVDDRPLEIPVRAGHVWYTPRGAWHAMRNTGTEPLTLVFRGHSQREGGTPVLLPAHRREAG